MNPLAKALEAEFGDELLPVWERLLEARHQARRCRGLETDLGLIDAAEALADVAARWQSLGEDQPWHRAAAIRGSACPTGPRSRPPTTAPGNSGPSPLQFPACPSRRRPGAACTPQ